MTTKRTDTFGSAVTAFEKDATWLGAADQPALVALRKMAAALDGDDLSPAMLAQFGLCYRNLLKRAPADAPAPVDPVEAALQAAGA